MLRVCAWIITGSFSLELLCLIFSKYSYCINKSHDHNINVKQHDWYDDWKTSIIKVLYMLWTILFYNIYNIFTFTMWYQCYSFSIIPFTKFDVWGCVRVKFMPSFFLYQFSMYVSSLFHVIFLIIFTLHRIIISIAFFLLFFIYYYNVFNIFSLLQNYPFYPGMFSLILQ